MYVWTGNLNFFGKGYFLFCKSITVLLFFPKSITVLPFSKTTSQYTFSPKNIMQYIMMMNVVNHTFSVKGTQ